MTIGISNRHGDLATSGERAGLDLGLLIEGDVAGVGSAQDSPDAAPQSASSA